MNENAPTTPRKRRKSRSPRPSPGQRSRTSEGRNGNENKKMPRQRRRRSFNEDVDEWGSGSGLGVPPSDFVEPLHRSPAKLKERRVRNKTNGAAAEGRKRSDTRGPEKSPRKLHDSNANRAAAPVDTNPPRKQSRRISSESECSLLGRAIASRQHKRSIGIRPGGLDSPMEYPIREEREDLYYP
uniref:Uncharacterized protein n=1 Tax=Plectus sambesii TaxID=2011161 RepID=A0A914VMK2_9BILA